MSHSDINKMIEQINREKRLHSCAEFQIIYAVTLPSRRWKITPRSLIMVAHCNFQRVQYEKEG